VFGCGYVGLTTAVGLAETGNRVIGIDTDAEKLRILRKGRVPFYEPGLQELLQKNVRGKRLTFSADARTGIEHADIIFCAVGTPPLKNNNADLSAVLKVARAFGQYGNVLSTEKRGAKKRSGKRLGTLKIFINKSTVPVGTSEQIRKTIEKFASVKFYFRVVSNPEFLREGSAVRDFFKPDRVIIGLEKEDWKLKNIMKTIYLPLSKNGVPLVFTDIRSAEVIKYASNAYLATRISFINELANFCEKAGADIKKVAKGIGMDKRIGTHYLEAGIGFGGSCLPKDLNSLIEIGKKRGHNFELLKAVQAVNKRQAVRLVEKLEAQFDKGKLRVKTGLRGKTVAIWGLSFKSKTDDLRDAPSLNIIRKLLQLKVKVQVYDPAAMPKAKAILGSSVRFFDNYYSVLDRADALIICTDWNEFSNPDYAKMRRKMSDYYILDGRNLLDPAEAAGNGFEYQGVGRG